MYDASCAFSHLTQRRRHVQTDDCITRYRRAGLRRRQFGADVSRTRPRSPRPRLTKDGYAQAKKDADAQYKRDKEACASLSGNAKDICIAEAKGKDDIARAEAAAAYENTPKTRENARVAHAEAT